MNKLPNIYRHLRLSPDQIRNQVKMQISHVPPAAPQSSSGQDRQVAEKLEQAFLEEMLKYAGPQPSDHAFGGGIGEEQFSTFLTREYAAILADSLDLGLGLNGRSGADA